MRDPGRKTVRKVRVLRHNPTDAETKLWLAVRDRRLAGFKFVRQEAIGPYVVDFICREARLVVEVDGGQHNESWRDRIRDAFLSSQGYHVARFWNSDVLSNIDGVLQTILSCLNSSHIERP